jgi:serine/threonine-protein kinase
MLAERLSAEDEDRLLAHVQACTRCQECLEELTAFCASGSSPEVEVDEASRLTDSSPENGPFWHKLKAAVPGSPSTIRPEHATGLAREEHGSASESARLLRLGRYELLEEIGRGGMGTVLRGHDPDLGRDLAVKLLLPNHQHDPAMVSRFTDEAQIGGQLQHPGIVPVYEVGRAADQRPYFTMKLIRGRTLAELLSARSEPRQDLPRFVHVFEQVCQTMAYAHSRGVIHRDLKPSNVMVGAFGEVQVMDWGLAKVLERPCGFDSPAWCKNARPLGLDTVLDHESEAPPRLTHQAPGNGPRSVRTVRSAGLGPVSEPGHVLGTPAYMPPEQASGEVDRLDERSDVFGLGAMLCEILTGKPPYGGADDVHALQKAMRGDLIDAFVRLDACGAHPDLIRLARSSLAATPADRPSDASVLATELAAHRESVEARLRQVELAQAEARTRAEESRKRLRVKAALAGSVLLTCLIVGAGVFVTVRAREVRESQARDALAQARASWERARAQNDPAQWAEAQAMARRAEALLEQGPRASEIGEQVRGLLQALDDDQADRQMILWLREAILRSTLGDEQGDKRPAIRAFEDAFESYGIPVQRLSLAEATERLRARPIYRELAAALDHWAALTGGSSMQKHLEDLARAVDDDIRRNEIRQALAQNDLEALKRFSKPDQGTTLPPVTVGLLARALIAHKAVAETQTLLRRAHQEHPDDFWIFCYLGDLFANRFKPSQLDEGIRYFTAAVALHNDSPIANMWLGVALARRGKLDEAQQALEKALQLQPDHAGCHNNLGLVFYKQGQRDRAIYCFREAIRLKPDFAIPYNNLGLALTWKNKLEEAITCYRRALKLKKDYPDAHLNLGLALYDKGLLDEAIASYRDAIRFEPDYAKAHCYLGAALRDQGQLVEALASMRRGHTLAPQVPAWDIPSAEWVRQCERLVALEPRFEAIRAGKTKAANATEQMDFAWLCNIRRMYAAAAGMYAEAFADQGKEAEQLLATYRYMAACAAAAAGCGLSPDASTLDEKARRRWRRQAQEWLRAELVAHSTGMENRKPADIVSIRDKLDRWNLEPTLTGVRGAESIAKLPAQEQEGWTRLWADAAALRKKIMDKN